jgi:hypothetical protein
MLLGGGVGKLAQAAQKKSRQAQSNGTLDNAHNVISKRPARLKALPPELEKLDEHMRALLLLITAVNRALSTHAAYVPSERDVLRPKNLSLEEMSELYL